VVSGKKTSSPIETQFWTELKYEVNRYFEKTGQSSKGNNFMYFKSFVLLFLTFFVYYLAMQTGFWILGPILGILMAINGLAIQHDGNHGSFSNTPALNSFFGAVDDFVVGGSSLM